MHGLQLGARVAVWSHEEGTWQEGTVNELSVDAGEFLVDYDDEAEGQGWTSVNQTWKHLSLAVVAAADDEVDDVTALNTAVLQQPMEPPPPPEVSAPAPAVAREASTPPPEQGLRDSDLIDLLRQLYDETVRSDGFGAEAPTDILRRFDELHERTAAR
mmetsp:Transcript_32886/g.96821  ORF Transcript_32886/g.96821 Transcript_32886/m.96821 type:complete len:158 (-) Transcript_32886:141-614(-)